MLEFLKERVRRVAKHSAGERLTNRLPRRVDLPFSDFGLEVGPNGHLRLGNVDLVDLVARHGSPLHVVDGPRLDDAARSALEPVRTGVGCDVYYSYKTNPIPAVLARLHAQGIGAEVISEYELWLAFELGVPADRIIYNGPAKSTASLRRAISSGIKTINANSAGELERIAEIAEDLDRVPAVGLRLALPGMWGGQFGEADIDVVEQLVTRWSRDSRVDLVGIHVHRGVPIRTADDVIGHTSQTFDVIEDVHARTGWYPRIVDLGGSLTSPSVAGFPNREFRLNRAFGSDLLPPDPSHTVDVATASRLMAEHARERAVAGGHDAPEVVIEPGRALTSNTQFLLTSVLDVKSDRDPTHAVIDAGLNIAESATGEYHQLYSVSDPVGSADRSYRLAGPICTPADVIYNNWRLPELERGHVLAIMDAGAYFVPFSTSFSFPRPAIVMRDGDEVRVVREPESFEDIVRLDTETVSSAEDA